MTRFPQTTSVSRISLAALVLVMSAIMAHPGFSQQRDDFLDDFLPDAPLHPLDDILTDPAPEGWGTDVLGDPGALPALDLAAPAQLQQTATPDEPALPEGWR